MIQKLIKKMPIGLYDKSKAISAQPEVTKNGLSDLVNNVRLDYPEFHENILLLFSGTKLPNKLPLSDNFESNEVAPLVPVVTGIATGFLLDRVRKIHDNYLKGNELDVDYEIYNEDGCIPDPFKNKLKGFLKDNVKPIMENESNLLVTDTIVSVIDKIILPIYKNPQWITDMLKLNNEKLDVSENEIAPVAGYVVGVVIGAAISDGQVGKVIDAAKDIFSSKK